MSLVNEHLTYQIFRRAGLAAAHTGYAVVTINTVPSGIYVMREAINQDFLIRNLGKGNEEGNLYEPDYFAGGDFVGNPTHTELKDEKQDGRSRADIVALANAVKAATPATFVATVGPLFDIDRYVTYMAVEAVTSDYDGITYNNNSYIYNNPKDGRFILFPHGADQAFWCPYPGQEINRFTDPFQAPNAQTGKKARAVPDLDRRFREEVARIGTPPIWDTAFLLARMEPVAKLIGSTPETGQTAKDHPEVVSVSNVLAMPLRRPGATGRGILPIA